MHQDIMECFVVKITRTGWSLTTVVLNIKEKREGGENGLSRAGINVVI